MSIQGFKVEDSVLRYDYNYLDNIPGDLGFYIQGTIVYTMSQGNITGANVTITTSAQDIRNNVLNDKQPVSLVLQKQEGTSLQNQYFIYNCIEWQNNEIGIFERTFTSVNKTYIEKIQITIPTTGSLFLTEYAIITDEFDTTLTSTTLPAQGKAVGDAINALAFTMDANDILQLG